MLSINNLYHGDCLNLMSKIDDKSIDMILCDLPYGVTSRNKWDIIIPLNKLWKQYKRIIKDNGCIALTAIQPFASILITSNLSWFKYEWIWEKVSGTGFLNAKKQPLRNHEQVLIFYDKPPIYNPQFTDGKPYKCKQGDHGSNYGCRGKNVTKVITTNNGKRYPKTVQLFKYDTKKLHPTQKPLLLFEYLIKTYTNSGDLILDNCAGSCTTAIAAQNLNRNWICIEKELKYCKLSKQRILENKARLTNNA